ncbi:MAG: DUF6785 family protein [Armatimonadota bacterium]
MPQDRAKTPSLAPDEQPAPKARLGGFTARAVFLGLLLLPVNAYWVTVVEVRWYTLDGSCLPLFVTPVFMLLLLAAINAAVARSRSDLAFTQAEMLIVYIMVVVSSTLSGHDMVQNMFGTIGHAYHFATPENNYEGLFWRFLPDWMVVKDQAALEMFYEGGVSWRRPELLAAWAWPLLSWGVLMFAMIMVMLCINVFVRKAWTEHEQLSFPLVIVPLELTRAPSRAPLFRNRLMWAGFALAAVIDTINGLHVLFPSVPMLKVTYGSYPNIITTYLNYRPWNAISRMRLNLYPFMIGLAFFLPSDLSFSCWFFYLLAKAEQVGCALIGYESLRGLPYLNEQAAGAWLAFGVLALWGTKAHLREAVRRALGASTDLDDSDEPISYRAAMIVMLVGLAVIFVWCMMAGMSFWAVLGLFSIYYVLSIAMTRVRAELGTPHEIYFVNPHRIMTGIGQARSFGPRNLTIMATHYWYNRCYRCHPMPNQLEAFKMAEQSAVDRRRLFTALVLATLGAILASYWANLHVTYAEGAAAKCRGFKSWLGREAHDSFLRPWLLNPSETNWLGVLFMVVGAALVVGLKAARVRFVNLPFHHAGYALAISFAMDYFWFAIFISWLLKVTIMRYWGGKAHRQGVWLCIGLILGDYFVGSIWAIIGPALGIPTYKIFI